MNKRTIHQLSQPEHGPLEITVYEYAERIVFVFFTGQDLMTHEELTTAQNLMTDEELKTDAAAGLERELWVEDIFEQYKDDPREILVVQADGSYSVTREGRQ
jgi:hypothetical protein